MATITVDQWPHKASAVKDGAVSFSPIVATVKMVVDGKNGPGWKFEEDTTKDGQYTGATWWAMGQWNEGAQAYDPYTGPKFAKGQRVNVELRLKEGGAGKVYRNVRRMEAVSPDQASETQGQAEDFVPSGDDQPRTDDSLWLAYQKYMSSPETKKPWDFSLWYNAEQKRIERQSIEMQVTMRADAEVIVGLLQAVDGIRSDPGYLTIEAANKLRNDLWDRAAEILARYNRLADVLSHLPEPEQAWDAEKEKAE